VAFWNFEVKITIEAKTLYIFTLVKGIFGVLVESGFLAKGIFLPLHVC
jgi:hypothetical protein